MKRGPLVIVLSLFIAVLGCGGFAIVGAEGPAEGDAARDLDIAAEEGLAGSDAASSLGIVAEESLVDSDAASSLGIVAEEGLAGSDAASDLDLAAEQGLTGGDAASSLDIAAEEEPADGDIVKSFLPQGPEAGAELFPPNARPGGCYARVLVPAQYETEKVQMLKSEASERLEIVPAQFENVEETIVVQEASEKLEIIPATYEWIEEKVLVKPAFEKLVAVPAEYELVSEQVIDKPAHVVWEKGRGLIEKVDFGTGEIVCLKEVPATFKTVTKQVLKSPATTRALEVPAEFKTVKRRLMKTPPTTKSRKIPEQTKVQKRLKVVEPATVKRISIPEEYQTFTKRIKISEEKMSWKPVLCETNTTPQLVRQLQNSLKEKGFHPGPIDGTIGAETMKAVVAFQKNEGLPRGGLDLDTFQALKVDLPWFSESMAINTGGGTLK